MVSGSLNMYQETASLQLGVVSEPFHEKNWSVVQPEGRMSLTARLFVVVVFPADTCDTVVLMTYLRQDH